jgi:hypothetical protein
MSNAAERSLPRALPRARPREPIGVAAGAGRVAERIGSGDGQPAEALRDVHARASEIVAGIAADAAVDPELYLRTTVVPEGGE